MEVKIENVGPIEHLSVPVPSAGGVVVLYGRNGSGKTTALSAVDSLISGRGRVSVRDGEVRGEVTGLGVTMKVARSTRRTGELEVVSLDGRLSVAELVDPGIESADAADAKRIKALVAIADVAPDASLFHRLLPGGVADFETYVSQTARESEDLVTMAARIKRDLENVARTSEERAKAALAHAQAAREVMGDVDMAAEDDATKLQGLLEQAVRWEMQAKQRRDESSRKLSEADEARAALAAQGSAPAWTLGEADAVVESAQRAIAAATEDVRKHEDALRDARSRLDSARSAHRVAEAERDTIRARGDLAQRLDAAVKAAEGLNVAEDREAAERATERVGSARAALEQAAVVRRAKEQASKAEQHEREAREHEKRAASFRDAAKGCDDVLSSVVSRYTKQLKVEAGRLVTAHFQRGDTFFADLSDGERWKLALDIAIEAVGENGLLSIPQNAWQDLDPDNRDLIAEHVAGRGVVILTAEATDGELRASVYEAATAG